MNKLRSTGHRSSPLQSAGFVFATAFVASLFYTPLFASDQVDKRHMASDLKKGGYVIYIRHASTEKDYADQVTADTSNCSTQRTLSEKGWREAELIGSSFSILNIPVGIVYSSEYCRAWQTAKIAFGTYVKTSDLNFEKAEEYSFEQNLAMRNRTMPLLNSVPEKGTNTIIVGHDDPFEAATGVYPEPQGVAFILRPDGNGGFKIKGSIRADEWPQLISLTN